MKKSLLARMVATAMTLSVGLGITQTAEANPSSPTPSPSLTWSGETYNAPLEDQTTGTGSSRDGSHVGTLAIKLGLTEGTVSDALVAVRERERSAGIPAKPSAPASRTKGRGARQAAVTRALAEELRIDINRVSTSLRDLQAELTDGR